MNFRFKIFYNDGDLLYIKKILDELYCLYYFITIQEKII